MKRSTIGATVFLTVTLFTVVIVMTGIALLLRG
jgi:hypothetical protein